MALSLNELKNWIKNNLSKRNEFQVCNYKTWFIFVIVVQGVLNHYKKRFWFNAFSEVDV